LKAIQIHACGGADLLRYEETSDPKLEAARDVIVKVRAAAVNRADLALRSNRSASTSALPRIPGRDGAGTIVAVGATVNNLKIGDAVCFYPLIGCGNCNECAIEREHLCAGRAVLGADRHGTYAEYVTLPAKNCFAIPTGLGFEEAAALPWVYVAVWRLLITQARLQPGELLLISGAGGVGSAAFVLGRALATHMIVVSANAEKLAKAKGLGAEHGVERSGDWVKEVRSLTGKRGVDVVVDSVGGKEWSQSLAALARGGRLVTCGTVSGDHASTNLRRVFWNHLKIFGASAGSRAEFRRSLEFFAAGDAKPVIDRIYPLRDAAQAHRRMEAGAPFGKIILAADA